MDLLELHARECVRDTVARYTHAGDSGKLTELAECFTPDGTLEVKGRSRATGRGAIVEMLGGGNTPDDPPQVASGAKFFQRHFVANLVFDSITPDHISTRAYFVVFGPDGADHWGRYRDTFVPDGDRWLLAHRFVAVDTTAPDSFLAARWSQ
ncbi:nuclear transport factor 2 family protein [Rhodococcus rhodochrous]|nr:nuclear transport factor 2 family protein [Rhodococcus rhodochrous]MBF4481361.1 nuclear transport factor 2 family protein [Rhodococcus rhodochrous]MCB8913536.1 nuclear transport factor 2 family protein [Rhodococcus rhodochrous]MCD2100442.1 nuclear transport factor 2 family protein [Rhodococcus rhodochrous]MCD2124765.1 nuclear transport factor 2 family protein [Rhodococcus rhodochrous]MDJ0021613.1 nuclear transport factor 2 family protein [Rhodococcus rhodochrous]